MILYSNGCPRCKILMKKLEEKEIDFILSIDYKKLMAQNIRSVPVLETDDGQFLMFEKAMEYIDKGEL